MSRALWGVYETSLVCFSVIISFLKNELFFKNLQVFKYIKDN